MVEVLSALTEGLDLKTEQVFYQSHEEKYVLLHAVSAGRIVDPYGTGM